MPSPPAAGTRFARSTPPGARALSTEARQLTATLRWRARAMLRALPPRQGLAARLLPVLLQASFSQRELRGEPPGVEGVSVQPSWAPLARAFDLTPPLSRQGGRRLIQALFVAPAPQGLVGYAVLAANLGTAEARRVAERLAQVTAFYRHGGIPFPLSALPLESLAQDGEPLLQLMPFGALLAGWLPESVWTYRASAELGPASLARLLASAQGPVARLALLLLAPVAETPCAALRSALAEGRRPRELADPEAFCAHWVARAPGGAGAPLARAHALVTEIEKCRPPRRGGAASLPSSSSSSSSSSAAAPSPLAGRVPTLPGFARPASRPSPSSPPSPGFAAAAPPSTPVAPEAVLEVGRALMRAATEAVRAVPRERRAPFEALLRQEILGLELPRLLLPVFGAAMRARHDARGGRAGLQVRADDAGVGHVASFEGVALAAAATRTQALLRAQGLLAAAEARPRNPAATATSPEWKVLADRLGQPAPERALVVAIESTEADGSPHDPLNRGQSRIYGFEGALGLLERPGRRATAFQMNPRQTVEHLLREGARGTRIDLRAADSRAHPAVARLQRLARFARSHTPGDALAVEAGGRVAQLDDHGVRWFDLKRFALRPRRCRFDPEAPDLSTWAGEPARQRWAGHPSTISCQAVDLGNGYAGIFYLDAFGTWFREEVLVADLDAHLEDARLILREEPFPTLLAARLASDLEEQRWRRASEAPVANVELEVVGRLPFGLEVVFQGERFGSASALGWEAAAQAVLSSWPSGHRGRLAVRRVQVEVGEQPAHGVERLYARALVARRLERLLHAMGVT